MQHITAQRSLQHIKNLEEMVRGYEAEIRRLGGDPNKIEFSDGRIVIDSSGRRFISAREPGND